MTFVQSEISSFLLMKKHSAYTPLPLPKNNKRAFTLIEILVVISIIVILMGFTSMIIGGVGDTQGKARSKADMELIATALEAFRGKYGGYPRISCQTNEATNAGDLYKCLVGKMALSVKNGEIYMEDISTRPRRPFLDASKIKIGDPSDRDSDDVDSEKSGVFFMDAWREPYMYFYDTSKVAGTVEGVWRSPAFILLSKGPDQKHTEVKNMYATGIIPEEKEYFEKEENVDNILHGRMD